MTSALYLRPPAAGDHVAEWVELAADGRVLASASLRWPEDLGQLASQAQGKPLTVLLPVSLALVTRVQVPAKQRKHLAQVLPYLLEDQLAGSIDDLHIVPGRALDGDEQQVLAVEHRHLQTLFAQLREHGLVATELTLDALCLPDSEAVTVLVMAEDALLRLPDGSAQALARRDLDTLLPLLAGDKPVQLYSADSTLALQHPHQREDIESAMAWLAQQAQRGVPSLLQGDYAPRTAWHSHWQQWRKVAVVVGIAVLAQYAYAITDWALLKQRVGALDGAIRSSFAEAFPDQANTAYPIRSMNGYIKQLGNAGAGGFTSLLAEVAPVLQQTDGISLRGMGYEAGSAELRLDLSARDLSALNALDNRFQQMGFQTDLGQASAGSGGYTGRMVLKRASAGDRK